MLLSLARGFFLGLLLIPAMIFQTELAGNALGIDIACCETSQEGGVIVAVLLGILLGPLLGMFTTATLHLRQNQSRAARFCAFAGAILCCALPLFIAVNSFLDQEIQGEPNGVWYWIMIVSLPLAWSFCLLLFAFFARPNDRDEHI